ncbi:hypothetical protein [Spirosoma foliorum]|nr:hypothetical protein [Spirosoma foliorum]
MTKRPHGGPCVFDEAFKEMAVELSYAKGSIQDAAASAGRP